MSYPEKLKNGVKPCSIKLLQINDVYKLDYLPFFKTCKEIESKNFEGTIIACLPGDFLSPSALSGLDHGAGMIACLNQAGVDFVSFGNHEADIPFAQLIQRIRESKFTWINTNIHGMPLPKDIPPLPEFYEIEVKNGDHVRRIALLGLVTEDPTLYLKGAFGGATISPVIPTAQEYYNKLMATGKYDAIIPLTHSVIDRDRELMKQVPFPVLLGGHDHEPFNEVVNKGTILKMGMDGNHIGIVELTWPDATTKAPLVSITSRPASYYQADPVVADTAAKHMILLEHVKKSPLFSIPSDLKMPFSSIMCRFAPSPVASALLSIIRDALEADCCIVNSGCIRGSKDYSSQKEFWYADLEGEMPYSCEICVVQLPGSVIKRAICETRAPALQHPPVILGSYVQTDDSIHWDPSTNTVISIHGVPIDDHKLYSVATSNVLASGALRENPPISEYCNTLPPGTVPPLDACKGAKNIIVSHLSKSLLFGCIETIGLSNITKDDEEITKEELLQAVQKYEEKSGKASVFSDPAVLEIIVNNLFAVADLDGSGKVSKRELVALRLSMVGNMTWDNISTEHPSSIRVEDAATMVSRSLNIPVNDPAIVELMKQLDSNASGEVSITELREYIQKEMSMEKEVLI